MKPVTKANLLMFIGAILFWIGMFAKPLGIPGDFDFIPLFAAPLVLYLGLRANRKARIAGQIPATTNTQKRKQFVLVVITCAIGCSIMPFVLPATGVQLPFRELVIISLLSFVITIGAFWFGQKMRK